MARGGRGQPEATPPALPPERRPIGQLVAESIKLYGRRFWWALLLGVPLAVADQISYRHSLDVRSFVLWILGPAVAAAFVGACVLAADRPIDRRALLRAYVVAVVVYAPFPLLVRGLVLPGLIWFAVFGLAVPAALLERLRFREALRRGFQLGLADMVHALGGLCALTLVYGVSSTALAVLLRTQSDQAERAALLLSDLVLSPLVFLGGALLYFDQAARVVDSARPRSRRSRDADLRAAVEPDAAGRADAEVEPRSATRGQP